ncbi:hypothetical protein CPHO_01485 [Corynebacterium phocae]|uniref:Uncharacterized protein n=1 Tax=Corynebacterium phocae TaxID=161895 RepID=A0A1L7D132_9CORY|nr:hypothetical protein [Corynebacterium phocae]APT91804.1 hypothetical protein CPHO_01485 [Corynebacterium phocae]
MVLKFISKELESWADEQQLVQVFVCGLLEVIQIGAEIDPLGGSVFGLVWLRCAGCFCLVWGGRLVLPLLFNRHFSVGLAA